jgi:hypothetical protein
MNMRTLVPTTSKIQRDAEALASSHFAAGLGETIVERLKANGVATAAAWHDLGRQRLQIWGITRRVATQLDKLARQAKP